MPVSFQQVIQKIRLIASGAGIEEELLNSRRERARALLVKNNDNLAELIQKVGKASENDPILRCALPFSESLNTTKPLPLAITQPTLIAADGSQINPDRHAAINFSLINIGVIVMKPGSGETPLTYSYSDLKFGDELYTEFGLMSEDLVSLGRDLAERQKLLEVAEGFPAPLITLTDGPLEVWGLKQGFSETYQQTLETHLKVLGKMQERGTILAGVVDKPGANLVVRLLEIADTPFDNLKNIRSSSALRGVQDRWLFNSLPPGARSAVFGIQSNARSHYKGPLALHFFYLNTSADYHPNIVRVEIPAWVAMDGEKLDLLHSSLIEQCRIMGIKPYPYILHRAHEVAVVNYEEKKSVEQMLTIELLKAGVKVGENSSKQSAKGLEPRRRR